MKDAEFLPPDDALPVRFTRGKKQVFPDWWLVEPGYGMPFWPDYQRDHGTLPWLSPRGVRLEQAAPRVPEEPFWSDDPLGGIGGYSTLLHEGGRYRLWYETYGAEARGDVGAKICYLESADGRIWERPNLGLIEYGGSRDNNIVFGCGTAATGGDTGGHGGTVFRDPSAPPDERYKLVYVAMAPESADLGAWLYGAVSPDGLRWTKLAEPVLRYSSDTQSVGHYDVDAEEYRLYLRGWSPQGRGGGGGRRFVRCFGGKDFRALEDHAVALAPDAGWEPDTDIYTSAYHPWPGAERAHLMLPTLYRRNADTTEVHLATSRDGRRWQLPSRRPLLTWSGRNVAGAMYAGCGIVPFGEGRWAFPVAMSERTHNQYEAITRGLYWATVREDGLLAVDAELHGEFTTVPVVFDGSSLRLNAYCRPGGRIRVEIQDAVAGPAVVPHAGFALDGCDPVERDVLWREVTWQGNADLSSLGGRVVRLRFELVRARLFGFRFE